MENAVGTNHRVRFKAFELDLHTRELYRNGIRLRVQGQPIDVLEMLLERPGELVTREALRKKLWPEDTFVDFEHSLNSAVTRLRDALGDRAEDPKYIETLPRLGYRFVAVVENDGHRQAGDGASVRAGPAPSHHQLAEIVQISEGMPQAQVLPVLTAPVAVPRIWLNRRRWPLLAGASVVLLLTVTLFWYKSRALPLPHISETKQLTQDVRWKYKAPIGTDGSRMYLRTEPPSLQQIPISGGEVTGISLLLPWTSPDSAYLTDVSPDGTSLLARGFSPVKPTILPMWIMSTSGTPIRYLSSAYDGTWSPDGKQVIYSTDEGRVYTAPSIGGEAHLLFTSKAGVPWRFSWSPDRSKIRFSIGYVKIWEVSADGSNLHEFLPGMRGSGAKCCGRSTPDGDFYIFTSSKSPFINPMQGGQLWVHDERHGRFRHISPDPVQLTSNPVQWIYPVISQDSRTIYATGIANQGELVRLNTRSQQFERSLGGISAMYLEFSRDGKYLTYVSFPGHAIWRANRDGSGKALLIEPKEEPLGNLHWSPDGSKILYSAGFQFYLIPSHGGVPVRLPIENTGYEASATWSPDSRHLVYRLFRPLQPTADKIRILDLVTGESAPVPAANKPMFAPNWSPDGRYIFAATGPSAPRSAIFDLRKRRWTYFEDCPGVDVAIWSHDSRSLYFTSDVAVGQSIYRISIPSGRIERVADLKEFRSTGTWGGWFGLDPDDAPLLLHDVGTVEVYALTLERN